MKRKKIFNLIIRFLCRIFHKKIFCFITYVERVYLYLIGVNFGLESSFRGWTSFFFADDSKIQIGNNCTFNSNAYTNHIGLNHRCIVSTMRKGASVVIGNNCGFSSSTISSFLSIKIGNNVRVGANCVIADGDFHLDDFRVAEPRPIVIEDNVWLGYGVVVMKGVTIGKNSIIGMNSVVTKDIPANCVAAGNPCRVIKEINIQI